MFMIDLENESAISTFSLYLTVKEANEMVTKLKDLLENPEANEHFHLFDENNTGNEISCSIITNEKLNNLDKYNDLEKRIFRRK